VERAKQFYESGRTARGEYLQAEAQMAAEALNLVNARNRFALAKLSLAQIMTLETPEEFEVERPVFSDLPPELPPFGAREVYNMAVDQFPAVRSADLQYLSQERQLMGAKAALSPSLSAFGGIGTGFSQLARTQVGTTVQQQYIGEFQGTPVYIDVNVPVFEKTPFADQWSQNFNRTVGLSLNVPIFNNFRTKSQISMQKIALENARLQKLIVRNNLLRDIQTAWFDAKAAFERFKASEKNVLAQQEAFDYIKERYEAGLVNFFEFNAGKNQLAAAASNLVQAKYEYLLRYRVLDFYRGKPIEF
jgi:outer membrane protein